MFQTHPFLSTQGAANQGAFHAALRALGNGPVTVTDAPDRCIPEIFMRLCGQTRDGKTIALNARSPIEILDERCFDWVNGHGDGKGIRGYSKSDFGICMGIWNVREDHGWVRDSVSLEDAMSVLTWDHVICWSHAKQEVFKLKRESAEVVLGELEFDVITMVEMREDIVCLGLIDKYNTLAAIDSRGIDTWALKCLGEIVFVTKGHKRGVVKVEGVPISTLRYRVDNLTVLRASLKDFKDKEPSTQPFWTVQVNFI
jgi:hypothetical protein